MYEIDVLGEFRAHETITNELIRDEGNIRAEVGVIRCSGCSVCEMVV